MAKRQITIVIEGDADEWEDTVPHTLAHRSVDMLSAAFAELIDGGTIDIRSLECQTEQLGDGQPEEVEGLDDTEDEIVHYIVGQLVDDVRIREYIDHIQDKAGAFPGEVCMDERYECGHFAERANILYRLLGLVTATLYNHGVK